MDATRAMSTIARRAQDLFKQQQQIAKQVELRWGLITQPPSTVA